MISPNELCTSLTKDRKPCDHPRFGWTHFCWYHQPWAEVGLSTVIALLVGVNATWFIALRGQQWTGDLAALVSQRSTPHEGRNFELPTLQAGERVLIGSVSYDVSRDTLRLGDGEYQIDRSREGVFHLSGEIRDRGGNVVAQLKDSHLFVTPGLGYDLNADSSAIEVVDPESRPILQFVRDASGLVGWIGTYQRSGDVFLCGDPCATAREKEALPVLERQQRIFQYPGLLHPGARSR